MKKRILVIASKNDNKKREISALLKGEGIKVRSLNDTERRMPIIVENGTTFRQNAVKKAVTISKVLDGFVLADDSGLMVHALGGKPGVRSSRFARAQATDQENNTKLLRLMQHLPQKERKATFVCSIVLAEKGHVIGTVMGECHGAIGFENKGHNGFGYDPLFIPKGYKKTFAQMRLAIKNRISHRAKALKKVKSVIKKYL